MRDGEGVRVTTGGRPAEGDAAKRLWRCHHCGAPLATLVGRLVVYPRRTAAGQVWHWDGDTANLPARIACPACHRRNVKLQ